MPLAFPTQNPLLMPLVPEPPLEPPEPPPEPPPDALLVVVLIPAIGGRGVAGGEQAGRSTNKWSSGVTVNGLSLTVRRLTCFFQIQALFENINQWVFSLVAESAQIVVHVDGPHHGASKAALQQPVGLRTQRRVNNPQ